MHASRRTRRAAAALTAMLAAATAILFVSGSAATTQPELTGWIGTATPANDVDDLTRARLASQADADGSRLDGDLYVRGDARSVGTTVVGSTNDGNGICFVTQLPGDAGDYGGCAPALPESGVAVSVTDTSTHPGVIVSGHVADDVDRIVVVTRGDHEHEALLRNGQFLWAAADRSSDTPVALRVTRDGLTRAKDLRSWTAPVIHPDGQEARDA